MDLQVLALAKNYTDKQIEKAEMGDIELDQSLSKSGFAADAKIVGDKFKNLQIPPVDNTLTQEGAAADAKAVGEALKNVSTSEQIQANWEQNDETAIDFIKGRTHYVQEGIYLPVADFTMTSQIYSNPPVLHYYTDYRITINGMAYESRSDDFGYIYLLNNGVLIFGIYEIGLEDNAYFIAELGDMYAGQQCHIIIEEIVRKEELKQLDERYIPNTIARVSEIPEPSNVYIGEQEPIDNNIELWLNPTVETIQPIYPPATAKVGQTIVVQSVDENGAPIKWKLVDLPSGGSSTSVGEWQTVMDITVSEETYLIRQEVSGYSEYLVFVRAIPGSGTNKSQITFDVYTGSGGGSVERYQVNDAVWNDGKTAIVTQAHFMKPSDAKWIYGVVTRKEGATSNGKYAFNYSEGDIKRLDIYTSPENNVFGIGTQVQIFGR